MVRTLLLAAVLCMGSVAQAAEYPDRRIRVIAPFGAGASADVAVRLITGKMADILGQQFVVENRTGALGMTGTLEFSKAAPDGYTILYGNNGQITDVTAAHDAIDKKPPYDAAEFVPIGRAQQAYFTLVANSSLPVSSLKELAAYARANPGKLTFASGQPTAAIVAGLLRGALGLDIVEARYRSDPLAMNDVIAGHAHLTASAQFVVGPQIAAGKVRALGAVGPERNPFQPDVPSLSEQGAREFAELPSWGAFFGPPGFPPAASAKLRDALSRALLDESVADGMRRAGLSVRPSTPQELSELVAKRSVVADFMRRYRISIIGDAQ